MDSTPRVLVITGNHPRHKFLVDALLGLGVDLAWVCEKREAHLPVPPVGLPTTVEDLFIKHFMERSSIENSWFSLAKSPQVRLNKASFLEVSKETLNSESTLKFIRDFRPTLVLSYGCHILGQAILEVENCKKWNIHGGLSPWYKGTATHFWPSYFLEPQYTGMTLHETTSKVDAGSVLLQSSVVPDSNHGIHENACAAVLTFVREFVEVAERGGLSLNSIPGSPQKVSGRLFLNSHWNPHLLKVIYETFDNQVNRYCNSVGISSNRPVLENAFERLL